jgi:hypothetical protein
MKLRGQIYRTSCGSKKQRGRNDRAYLVAETHEEEQQLDRIKATGRPTTLRGSGELDRDLDDLRNIARSIDPEFKEELNIIRS